MSDDAAPAEIEREESAEDLFAPVTQRFLESRLRAGQNVSLREVPDAESLVRFLTGSAPWHARETVQRALTQDTALRQRLRRTAALLRQVQQETLSLSAHPRGEGKRATDPEIDSLRGDVRRAWRTITEERVHWVLRESPDWQKAGWNALAAATSAAERVQTVFQDFLRSAARPAAGPYFAAPALARSTAGSTTEEPWEIVTEFAGNDLVVAAHPTQIPLPEQGTLLELQIASRGEMWRLENTPFENGQGNWRLIGFAAVVAPHHPLPPFRVRLTTAEPPISTEQAFPVIVSIEREEGEAVTLLLSSETVSETLVLRLSLPGGWDRYAGRTLRLLLVVAGGQEQLLKEARVADIPGETWEFSVVLPKEWQQGGTSFFALLPYLRFELVTTAQTPTL